MSKSSEHPPVIDAPTVVQRLNDCRERIIEIWGKRARHELPAARMQTSFALRDHLPSLLKNLADTLTKEVDPDLVQETAEIGRDHGSQRATLEEYSLNQVLVEYRLLRQVIFEVLSEHGERLELKTEQVIHDVIDCGVANAAAEFLHIQSRREQGALEALRRSEERLALALDASSMGGLGLGHFFRKAQLVKAARKDVRIFGRRI